MGGEEKEGKRGEGKEWGCHSICCLRAPQTYAPLLVSAISAWQNKTTPTQCCRGPLVWLSNKLAKIVSRRTDHYSVSKFLETRQSETSVFWLTQSCRCATTSHEWHTCAFYRASAYWRIDIAMLSVCPSDCPSPASILWKQLNILSRFLQPNHSYEHQNLREILTGHPLSAGALNTWV